MAVPYRNQDYYKLKEEYRERRKKFTDQEFPPDKISLGISSANITWKRPQEICQSPRLVVKGLSADDARQGFVGDCWFVAACSALAKEERLWSKVVPDYKDQDWDHTHPESHCGIFHFRFWRFGDWVDVVVDDYLPVWKSGPSQNIPVFMKSEDDNEFWPLLLEKAYAKLAGSYHSISGGQTGDALVDFTGGVSEFMRLNRVRLTGSESQHRTQLFKNLQDAHDRHALITCSIAPQHGDRSDTVLSCGLVRGHAYTVTDIREMNMGSFFHREIVHMIKLRNPWGHKEWQGPWSDGSEEWQNVPDREKRRMGLVVADDGEFWMEFMDCMEWFTNITVCHLFDQRWGLHEAVFHGQWEGPSAGGCSNFRRTFFKNPQYSLTVHHDDEVMVSLIQKNAHPGETNYHIGFMIMKFSTAQQQPVTSPASEVGRVVFANRRGVYGKFSLDEGHYVIVPSTYEPGLEKQFLLRVYADRRIDALELTGHTSPQSRRGPLSTVWHYLSYPFRRVVWPQEHTRREHEDMNTPS